MTQTIPAKDVNIRYLIDNFGLQKNQYEDFFREWQDNLPELTDLEKQLLDKVKAGFINLTDYPPVLENVVRMAVVDPILFIGGFFLYPLYIRAEPAINLAVEDEDIIIKGKIDTLVLKDQFWAMVIESKKAEFSTEAGRGKILAYMLANPHPNRPNYGIISTGGGFIFVKLVNSEIPQYALSKTFITTNPGNELYDVLRILKRLTQIALEGID
ncbi:MAG: restriction endonuclease subunit R [Cyanobacteriota bacterium]|nr:restriction endonuclease subunit R [Cyanobacteriota bacterium]